VKRIEGLFHLVKYTRQFHQSQTKKRAKGDKNMSRHRLFLPRALLSAIGFFTILLSPQMLTAQISNPDVNREVIVMFQPNVVQLPLDMTEVSVDQLQSVPDDLRGLLQKHQVE
jgi:hypothetical protein